MADLKKMTLGELRALAEEVLGAAQARSKTKQELVAALERAQGAKGAGKRAGKEAAKAAGKGAGKAAGRAGKAAAGAAPRRPAAKAGSRREGPAASKPQPPAAATPDPEGFFVARVRGEEAVREAPHAMAEGSPGGEASMRALAESEPGPVGPFDEGLGDLPWGYGEDALVALARDPRTAFLYWEHTAATRDAALEGLDGPKAQLWIFARAGEGWERVRTVDFALESRGFYLHDLEPGRAYRAEIHLVDRSGRERALGPGSNVVQLPPAGASASVDDRFVRIPWEAPLGPALGPGRPGGPFPEETRQRLARLSDWSRFRAHVGSAGGRGEQPSSPSSPFGPPGEPER
ncbi:MAG TPA: DUF4912 domain-containing protein [Anaeromyxobacteraceae bacterium]|nr:DUF4912 domain-containing protein [Anaeromyxobacteraceae bacterium]